MPLALSLYHDQIGADGASAQPLPAAHRLLYVRFGHASVNGQTLNADEAIYCDGPVSLQSAGVWSQVWRWDLAPPNVAPALFDGADIYSSLRMSRAITHMPLVDGSRWLFRLDQIISAGGRIADRHQHPGPGIRCLLEGTFNVESVESHRDLAPGDPWYETGPDTVVAWGARTMPARFLRGMVLPVEWEGKVTGTWLDGPPGRRSNWRLLVDKIVTV